MLIAPHQLRWVETNLIGNGIKFVVIGGVAVKFYCSSRQTSDLDLFIGADVTTIDTLLEALPVLRRDADAKAKLLDSEVGHLQVSGPHAIDILTFGPGISFESALKTSEAYIQNDVLIPILGRSNLISHKQAVGAQKDFDDIKLLSADLDGATNR